MERIGVEWSEMVGGEGASLHAEARRVEAHHLQLVRVRDEVLRALERHLQRGRRAVVHARRHHVHVLGAVAQAVEVRQHLVESKGGESSSLRRPKASS